MPSASQTYVKGYAIDYTKIKDLIGATDVTDRRIGYIEYQIMRRVERDVHKLVLAQHIGDDESCFSVITLGEESFGEDLGALRTKEIPVPGYLRKLETALEGPDVYKLYGL